VTGPRLFSPDDAARLIAVPGETDDKYRRGVLGVVTGSVEYPGAAVLGVEAALRTGVGMVRYLGPPRATDLVLQRRPEAVTEPGRVQAWLLGSGMPVARTGSELEPAARERLHHALDSGRPLVLDAGALDLAAATDAPAVIVPHAGELARLGLLTELDELSFRLLVVGPGAIALMALEEIRGTKADGTPDRRRRRFSVVVPDHHHGGTKRHPALSVYFQALKEYRAAATAFGLTPSARIGLPTGAPDTDDDDEDLFDA